MERAENTARMLDVNYQMSLLPQSAEAAERGWRGLLSICELSGDFAKRYGEVTPRSVMDYMVSDDANALVDPQLPDGGARERARGARHADHRGLGDAEPDLARVPAHGRRATRSSATRANRSSG